MALLPAVAKQFYERDWVAHELLRQCRNRYLTLRFPFGLRRHYNDWEMRVIQAHGLKLWLENTNFIELHTAHENHLPTDLTFFTKNDVLEFIPEVSYVTDLDRSDVIIVDLDPKIPNIPIEILKAATLAIHAGITNKNGPFAATYPIRATKFRFSGNRSFHIYCQLDKPYPFVETREHLKKSLDVVSKIYPSLTYKNKHNNNDFIFVDIGALARHRCVRALWSLHAKTALVCVPVVDIKTFQREMATIEHVLQQGVCREEF